jgi:nucleoside-diphosphate-sugar epimerase
MITGATGFIGRCAVELAAARGAEVHAVSSSSPDEPISGVEYHRLDLLGDIATIREQVQAIAPTHLLHLAWYAVPGKFWNATENEQWVEATMALADAFAEAGGKRFVGSGTCAEYAWRGDGVFDERTTACEPATKYGLAKDTTRRRLEQWGAKNDISFAWGRIFFLYGPREADGRLVSSVISSLLAGEDARVTEGRQLRDFLHVRDVADALVTLLLSDVRGAVNIASGEPVAVRDLIATIGRELQAEDRIHYGALPMRSDEPALIAGDATRLRRELQWTPHFDLAAGLRDTIDWWKHRGRRAH